MLDHGMFKLSNVCNTPFLDMALIFNSLIWLQLEQKFLRTEG